MPNWLKPASGDQFAVLSQAFLLPTASQATIRFDYQQPGTVINRENQGESVYQLVLQKQAGVPTLSAEVVLRTPENAIVSHMQPDTCSFDGVRIFCPVDVNRDRVITIRFQTPEEAQP